MSVGNGWMWDWVDSKPTKLGGPPISRMMLADARKLVKHPTSSHSHKSPTILLFEGFASAYKTSPRIESLFLLRSISLYSQSRSKVGLEAHEWSLYLQPSPLLGT